MGRLIGMLMNGLHTHVYRSYIESTLPPDNSVILDIGCGGGRFVEYLSGKNRTYKLLEIYHPPEMVELSRVNRNRAGVEGRQVTIAHASVVEMPIESNCVEFVTAFETVQFWPNMSKSFSEVLRVLRSGGTFLIINRYPRERTKWWKRAQLKSDREYIEKLGKPGLITS